MLALERIKAQVLRARRIKRPFLFSFPFFFLFDNRTGISARRALAEAFGRLLALLQKIELPVSRLRSAAPTAGNEHPVLHWEWAFSGAASTSRTTSATSHPIFVQFDFIADADLKTNDRSVFLFRPTAHQTKSYSYWIVSSWL